MVSECYIQEPKHTSSKWNNGFLKKGLTKDNDLASRTSCELKNFTCTHLAHKWLPNTCYVQKWFKINPDHELPGEMRAT